MAKKLKGYEKLYPLTGDQATIAAEFKRQNLIIDQGTQLRHWYVPQCARYYKLTDEQLVSLLNDFNVMSDKNIRYFQRYGTKEIKYTSHTAQTFVNLRKEGKTDDDIAQIFKSTYAAVKRARSTLAKEFPHLKEGLIAFQKAVTKGHTSKHTRTFTDSIVTASNTEEHQDLTFSDNEVVQTKVVQGQFTFEEQVLTNQTGTSKKLHNVQTKNTKPIENTTCLTCLRLVVDTSALSASIQATSKLNHLVTWREVAKRLQNSDHLYQVESETEIHYFQQAEVDAYSGLVYLDYVRSVSIKKTATV
jgi:hypothetical protein